MAKAAELRAGGISWEAIAAEVGRAARTIREWPRRYRAEWDRLFGAAEERLTAEASAQALVFLRKFLRADDPRLAQDTAKFLFAKRREACARLAAAPAGAPRGDGTSYLAYLEALNDAEVKAYLGDYLARRRAQAGPAAPASADTAGPAPPG